MMSWKIFVVLFLFITSFIIVYKNYTPENFRNITDKTLGKIKKGVNFSELKNIRVYNKKTGSILKEYAENVI
jgi:hypothetical protein